jgi:hypothetical protein
LLLLRAALPRSSGTAPSNEPRILGDSKRGFFFAMVSMVRVYLLRVRRVQLAAIAMAQGNRCDRVWRPDLNTALRASGNDGVHWTYDPDFL